MIPPVNYLAVLVAGIVIFLLGGLWYSPALFAKRWVALQGRTMEEMKASTKGSMPLMYASVFVCGLIISWALAVLLSQHPTVSAMTGIRAGAFAWLGFAATTSYGTALFSGKPKQLWLIDSLFNLVSFIIAGVILALWR